MIVDGLRHLSLAGAFASMFIENIGIPFPTEFGYLAAVNLLTHHRDALWFILTVLTAGSVLGSAIAYVVGRRGTDWLISRFNSPRQRHRLEAIHTKIIRWYERYGIWTVLATRFIGYVRPWSSFVAGAAKFPFWPFIGLTTLGSLVFNALALIFSHVLLQIWYQYAQWHVVIAIVLLISFFPFLFWHGPRRSSATKKGENGTEPTGLRQDKSDKQ